MTKTLCEAINMLPKNPRKTIIMIVLNNGYAVKDVAELMGVSVPAVSRYIHDELAPSTPSICRLIESIDYRTRTQITNYVIEQLWSTLSKLLREEAPSTIIEHIADEIAQIIMNKINKEQKQYNMV